MFVLEALHIHFLTRQAKSNEYQDSSVTTKRRGTHKTTWLIQQRPLNLAVGWRKTSQRSPSRKTPKIARSRVQFFFLKVSKYAVRRLSERQPVTVYRSFAIHCHLDHT